jgi:putative permease
VFEVVKQWWQRYLSDPQAVLLMVMLGGITLVILFMGKILAPVIASIVIAYLLQWVAKILVKWHVPQLVAVLVTYCTFLGLFFGAIFILWPIIWHQLLHLYTELPAMITSGQEFLYLLPEKIPEFVTKEMVDSWTQDMSAQIKLAGKWLFTASVASVPTVIALIVYLILVPVLVFFFLKDSKQIVEWVKSFLPEDRRILSHVWEDVDGQIGNYIRGKVAEVLIMGIATYGVFYLFEFPYAALLASLVGMSVIIPYVGIAVVTVPVVLVALLHWGIGPHFAYATLVYAIIQIIDGYLLVPLLFSEAVNIHPVAIIIAILIFGSWWGFWGVFFAIPLATLVKAVIKAWPRSSVRLA